MKVEETWVVVDDNSNLCVSVVSRCTTCCSMLWSWWGVWCIRTNCLVEMGALKLGLTLKSTVSDDVVALWQFIQFVWVLLSLYIPTRLLQKLLQNGQPGIVAVDQDQWKLWLRSVLLILMLYHVLYIGKLVCLQCALLSMAGHIGICGWLVSNDVDLQ